MPIYDYECTSCGHKAEVMRKISEPNVTACPACGKETFAKQVSAPSFQLTGSGWYATDFKGGQKSEPKSVETSAAEAKPTACNPGCACH
jgi:putative FmdB family regulatory protein